MSGIHYYLSLSQYETVVLFGDLTQGNCGGLHLLGEQNLGTQAYRVSDEAYLAALAWLRWPACSASRPHRCGPTLPFRRRRPPAPPPRHPNRHAVGRMALTFITEWRAPGRVTPREVCGW
jgi:hypothetical protein